MTIRDLKLPDDRAAVLSFIMGSQHYEHAFEPNRRLDPAVAEEQLAFLLDGVGKHRGRVFVADDDGQAIGWAVFVVGEAPVFVVEAERTHGYVAELFVTEGMRGRGVGRALLAACEEETRRAALKQIKIGLLTANRRAAEVYAGAGFAPYASELRKYL
jgi:GNAT superfamily N-acetyltransferase